MEVYSYNKYKGYHLFVEAFELEEDEDYSYIYYGVAQHNGTTIYNSKSVISGDKAEQFLKDEIDEEFDNE